ncbi:Arabidopsis Toxicos en Levadura 23 [Hibiscus trionum]|uniref:RING-type E3 ubiquitin transferase n=1 Tax=Hibiscus trionum TaxID=183268 RepID=A0A9W7HBL2_HIBTR|nr:Arabidopsis Toxicos en Levadura 23 [Hibiscus trionum]
MAVRLDIIVLVLWGLNMVLMLIATIICWCRDSSSRDLETGQAGHPVGADRAMQVSRPSTVGVIVRYENGEESISCVICLEELKVGDTCRLLVSCKHLYHQLCVDQWLSKDMHCPICRGSVHGLELSPTSFTDNNETCSPQIST